MRGPFCGVGSLPFGESVDQSQASRVAWEALLSAEPSLQPPDLVLMTEPYIKHEQQRSGSWSVLVRPGILTSKGKG